MNKKFLWAAAALLSLIVLVALGVAIARSSQPKLRGSVIDPPALASDFTLTDQSGAAVSLSDFRGKYVLLFFGFTNCDDECPATMAILDQTVMALGEQAREVRVVFISTDPARDTTQAMSAFVDRFDPDFIGLTGSEAELQPVWKDYGVTVMDGGETHSTYVYLIDPQGKIRLTYPFPMAPEDLTADLRTLFERQ